MSRKKNTPEPAADQDHIQTAETGAPEAAHEAATVADPIAEAAGMEIPDAFVFGAGVQAVYESKYVLVVTQDDKTATLEFAKHEVSYDGQADGIDLQEGYQDIIFTVPYALAVGKHLPEFFGCAVVDCVVPAPVVLKPDGGQDEEPHAAPCRHHLRTEVITVTVHLDPAEREAVGQRMADATAKIEELEDDLDSYRKTINAEIKEAEKDLRAASRLWHSKREEREISCDVIADYNTGEIVWTERTYPYKEMQRRPMTEKERQLPLPLDVAGPSETQDGAAEDAQDEQPAETADDAESVTLSGRVVGITEYDITIIFADSDGNEYEYELPRAEVTYEGDMQPGDTADFTMTVAVAVDQGIISRCGQCMWNESENCKDCFGEEMFEAAAPEERSCGTCAHIHQQPNEGEDDPCFDCGQDQALPNWKSGPAVGTEAANQQHAGGAL